MTGMEFHPPLQMLERYLDESLPEFEQAALEDHFAECQECSETLARMEATLFSGFTAQSHAAAIAAERFQVDPLAKALRTAQRLYGQYAATLRRWLDSADALWDANPAKAWGEWGAVPVSTQPDLPLEIELGESETRARVSVHRDGMTVAVKSSPGRRGDLAVLFEAGEEERIFAAVFETAPWGSGVTFHNVPRGRYSLAVASPGEVEKAR